MTENSGDTNDSDPVGLPPRSMSSGVLPERYGATVVFCYVIASQWHRALLAGELDLEVHVTLAAEREFRSGQVELEHAAEAFVVQRGDRVAVGGETTAPMPQGLGVVQPQ